MVKYLQMDGVDDLLRGGTVTANRIIIDYEFDGTHDESYSYIFDTRTTGSNWLYISSNNTYGGAYGTGVLNLELNKRMLVDAQINSFTGAPYFFYKSTGNYTTKAKVYDIKLYNGTTLVAHYDMSTGTVLDQSGNGNHATLTGGTWLDDGTGGTTDPGTDGAIVFDSKQIIYSDGFTRSDSRQSLYQDSATTADTRQVLYDISSTSFDMLQEIFNDGQVGSTPFDMRLLLYSDGSILHDSRQQMYELGQRNFDLQQAIYETGESKGDMHIVLFADSSAHHDLIQSLYADAAIHFDTKQISFNPDQQKIGTIRLKGKRNLYIYLVGKQELFVPLKAKRELTVSLKGGVNMTMQNQNFSMSAGDTKYIVFPIEGVTDLTGAVITWGAKQRSYSNVANVLVKSTGNGITVEGSEVKIKLSPEDTELLSGTYHHECELEDNLQNVSTVFTGLMTVNKSAV